MSLGDHSITSWDEMRKIFLRKYQAYCTSKDLKDDIFRMSQQEDESLEEYLERFSYNLQKSKYNSLTPEMIRIIFLKGIREEYLDILNVMGKGDISYFPLMRYKTYVRSIQEERLELEKGISLPKLLNLQPVVSPELSLGIC